MLCSSVSPGQLKFSLGYVSLSEMAYTYIIQFDQDLEEMYESARIQHRNVIKLTVVCGKIFNKLLKVLKLAVILSTLIWK